MAHRANGTPPDKGFFQSEGYQLLARGNQSWVDHHRLSGFSTGRRIVDYLRDDADPIGRAMRRMIVTALVLYGCGLALTILGCILAAVNPFLLLMLLGGGVFIAGAMALVLLVSAANVGRAIWRYGTMLNRFSLVAAPLVILATMWRSKDSVMNATDKLGHLLYNTGGLQSGGNVFVKALIVFFVQALVWAALFGLPIFAMHGLSVNKARLNKPPHKLTNTTTGQAQTVFWHIVTGYGLGLLAAAAWLPYFAVLF